MKYVVNNSNDSRCNLAFEEYCFKYLDFEDEIVFLWQNSPTVVIGKNQNTLQEINENFIRENNINVVRRITGGGAVYHDLGNLNYTFIIKAGNKAKIDFEKYSQPMIRALKKFGVECEITGRNDITIEGKKISGAAQSLYKDRVLHHGTLLIDSKLDTLSKALKAKPEKFISKGIKSVRSRVTNIKPYLKQEMDIEKFKKELLTELFNQQNQTIEELKLSSHDLEQISNLFRHKYSTWEWNYGNSPDFNYKKSMRAMGGTIEVNANVKNGIVDEFKIFGDFFGTKDKEDIEKMIIGCKFDRIHIAELLKNVNLKDYFGLIEKEEFLDCIFD